MKRCMMLTTVFLLMAFTVATAAIIHVPGDYSTIQAGIDATEIADTVLVQPGTYVENIDFNGHNIVLGSLFLTTDEMSYISSTIIDGNSSGAVITLTNEEDNFAMIIGFTIINGVSNFGGGINAWYTSPTILHNIIKDNVGSVQGGGVSLEYSTGIVLYNVLANNQAEYGGGLRASHGNPVIAYNLIVDNYSLNWGGGMYVNNNTPLIINNTFSGNEAVAMGGGLRTGNASPTVTNCIFYNNSAPDGPEISAWGNPTVTYSDIRGGYNGVGNISADPLFIGGEPFDFRLQAGSPCIDAGDPDSPLDPDGSIADMGAYYFGSVLTATID
ncbi:MAG: right-handed parallel beta-helix repeat-containing protein, partial [candidate division Zixibacteria bacterium]